MFGRSVSLGSLLSVIDSFIFRCLGRLSALKQRDLIRITRFEASSIYFSIIDIFLYSLFTSTRGFTVLHTMVILGSEFAQVELSTGDRLARDL